MLICPNDDAAPLPPTYLQWRKYCRHMLWRGVKLWLDRYNSWVEVWNKDDGSYAPHTGQMA